MPIDEYGKADPKTIGLDRVETGQHYAPVISTSGGLWRYLVGDTISFTSLNPYRIKVTGRVKHYMNAFGEEVIVDNADQAIASACMITGASVSDYTAAPVFFSEQNNGCHEWLIAFSKPPDSMIAFSNALDESLQSLNSDYEAKRKGNIALSMPKVQAVSADVFNRWLEKKGKLGGQHKIPRLSNERKMLEEILDCR
jgi:hypothetical protein